MLQPCANGPGGALSAKEVQTLFSKMENFTAALSMPGQAKVLLEVATLPLGYFFLYRLFGPAAIAVSIAANVGISAIAAKVGTKKTKTEQKLRELRKKQEGILNELAANLPIWKLYGWTDYFVERLNSLTDEQEQTGRLNAAWKTLAEVLPNSIGPTAVLISVGINVLRGGQVQLVKLLTAGSYITIISQSMQSITESRQQWRDLCAECKNIDEMYELPDSQPLKRTADGSIRLQGASFGWPVKPPTKYSVKANDTPVTAVTEGELSCPPLQEGQIVSSVDGQKNRDSVRVCTAVCTEGGGGTNGWVKLSALAPMPEPSLAEWPAPATSVAEVDLLIQQGELVLISGPVAGGKSTLLQSLVGNTEQLAGSLAVPNSVAFQPQSPILFDQTIR